MEQQQRQLVWKHRGDLAYASGEWSKAEAAYCKCLDITAKGKSMGMRRDCYEGLARCSLKMEKKAEALEWAQKLVQSSCST